MDDIDRHLIRLRGKIEQAHAGLDDNSPEAEELAREIFRDIADATPDYLYATLALFDAGIGAYQRGGPQG